MAFLPALAVSAALAFDAEAALQHAAKLSALGPHAWGSPRNRFAAEYVAAQFREAQLQEVRLQEFESSGIAGANVIGVLRAPGPETIVVGAHHDTAPEAPGAYDDGGGVGVLIEVARVLASRSSRPRTIVFVSWDGEEAWATGKGTTTGSRAFIKSLGREVKNVVAVLAVEMCGWKGGTPVLHPIPYVDPLRPGASVVTPAWLLRAALEGSQEAGGPMPVGDPILSWLYQPAVRTFRAHLYGDDLSFLQSGIPAVFVADSSFSAFYPWYHQAADTADKLDAPSLERMGRRVLGIATALGTVAAGPAAEPAWFAGFGRVLTGGTLLLGGALTLVPGLLRGVRGGGLMLPARLFHAALFGVLLWRYPVPALWSFALPNLLTLVRGRLPSLVALSPLLALAGLGAAAWRRGMVGGIWLAPWELAIVGLALALLWIRPAAGGRRKAKIVKPAPLRRR